MTIKTESMEVATLEQAMIFYRGNQSEAARDLDINRGTLRTYLKQADKRLLRVIRFGGSIYSFELINKCGGR